MCWRSSTTVLRRWTSPIRLVALLHQFSSCIYSVRRPAIFSLPDGPRCATLQLFVTVRHWLPIQRRIDYKLCMTVHRRLHGQAPSYLIELITPSAAAHTRAGLRSADLRTVAVPRTYSSLEDRAFAVAASSAWNSISFPLRAIVSVDCFTKQYNLVSCEGFRANAP